MCGGVTYAVHGNKVTVYFPSPEAKLPILLKDGSVELYHWGRRANQSGRLPLGGWARHDSIKAGKWNQLNPRPCKIMVDAFMEKDNQKKSHWFDINEGSFIQGLYASLDNETKVYVVTIDAEGKLKKIHSRFPRILTI